MVNDPVGDMLTPHPQCGHAAQDQGEHARLAAARPRARRAAVRRFHPRLQHDSNSKPMGAPEFEIELKYFDGEPVIRKIARVSKPGRRVYSSVQAMPPRGQWARHHHLVDAGRA
jgi:small subunit ribosomal protein S8